MMLALYQPDIPQNCGTMLRMCACLSLEAAIIEPAAFPVGDRHFRRAGLDYLDKLELTRFSSFAAFATWLAAERRRLVLLTTRGDQAPDAVRFRADDVLLVGRESAGVPDAVHAAAQVRVVIPMRADVRSLNVAVAAAIVTGEALRQTGGFPPLAAASAG